MMMTAMVERAPKKNNSLSVYGVHVRREGPRNRKINCKTPKICNFFSRQKQLPNLFLSSHGLFGPHCSAIEELGKFSSCISCAWEARLSTTACTTLHERWSRVKKEEKNRSIFHSSFRTLLMEYMKPVHRRPFFASSSRCRFSCDLNLKMLCKKWQSELLMMMMELSGTTSLVYGMKNEKCPWHQWVDLKLHLSSCSFFWQISLCATGNVNGLLGRVGVESAYFACCREVRMASFSSSPFTSLCSRRCRSTGKAEEKYVKLHMKQLWIYRKWAVIDFFFVIKHKFFHISVMSSFAEKETIFLLFFPNIISFPFSCQRRNNIFSEQHTFCLWMATGGRREKSGKMLKSFLNFRSCFFMRNEMWSNESIIWTFFLARCFPPLS